LGRSELRHLTEWTDGRFGTELNFKLYRQATNKIIGISDKPRVPRQVLLLRQHRLMSISNASTSRVAQ